MGEIFPVKFFPEKILKFIYLWMIRWCLCVIWIGHWFILAFFSVQKQGNEMNEKRFFQPPQRTAVAFQSKMKNDDDDDDKILWK